MGRQMRLSFTRAMQSVAAVGTVVALAACGSSSKSEGSSGNTTTTAGSGSPSVSATSFTSDFSAMNQLKGLASQGKGLVGVLLPDTTTSARYESFDRPYLIKAFQAAGLSDTQFKVD